MGDVRIDYSGLSSLTEEAQKGAEKRRKKKVTLRSVPLRVLRAAAAIAVLAVLPFALLIRGGVFAYSEWDLGTWPALVCAALATALLLWGYAWLLSRRFRAGKGTRKLLTRGAAGVAIAYVSYGLVFVASANVKSEAVRAEYASIHPLLRIASSSVILIDPGAVITDAGRTQDDYRAWGLPVNEASLHFQQDDGYVHALDLRTQGRPEWRNRTVELAFWALGFHSLRHVGTADHLHISLRPPA